MTHHTPTPEPTAPRGRPGPDSQGPGNDQGDTDVPDQFPSGWGRQESRAQRADRNFTDLLQEMRVLQTGVQVLTGFLLTLPFQARFAALDAHQRVLYLVLVSMSVLTTSVLIAPVSIHRILFQRGLKPSLVRTSNMLARTALFLLALTITGTAVLAFDVVVSRTAGIVVGIVMLTVLAVLWVVVPLRLAATAPALSDPESEDAGTR